ncbi:MAG: PorT family protein [Chitinophaga sp.]|uniref:porin family protein n=1 Tax=Chitinophaga sp. TaxID=1869181 RepID=UPI0025B895A0|nr:porin family protein [Chitinophaga sp.]MBV8254558.1 PorT family protein [Chitinophaga sp.]
MKMFTLAAVAACFTVSYASAQVSIGFRGGYVNSNLSIKQTSTQVLKPGTKSSDNWGIGMVVNVPIANNFYLQPILNYEVKGAELASIDKQPTNAYTTAATSLKLKYLTLPVNFVYKIPLGKARLAVGGGPYAGYCLKARYDLSVYNEGRMIQNVSQDVAFGSSPTIANTSMQLKRWDAGINALATIEFNSYVTLGANYSMGLLDIDQSSDLSVRNRSFGISLGVLLNREDW